MTRNIEHISRRMTSEIVVGFGLGCRRQFEAQVRQLFLNVDKSACLLVRRRRHDCRLDVVGMLPATAGEASGKGSET